MVFLKFVFISLTLLGTFLPASSLFAQDMWQLDLSTDKNTARLNLRLAYLKLAHVLPRLPSSDFVSFEEFMRILSHQEKKVREQGSTFEPTLGELKQIPEFKIEVEEKPTRSFAFLTPGEVLKELIQELSQWKDELTSRDLPLLEVRERMALAYCKALSEKTVQEFLRRPENSALHEQLLKPIATLLKVDRDWALRAKVLDPVLNLHPDAIYGLFEGTIFESDPLTMDVSDANHDIQAKLLKHFYRKFKNNTTHPRYNEFVNQIKTILRQLSEEDARREIRQLAQEFIIEINPNESTPLDTDGVLAAAPAKPTTKRIKKSTRMIEKPRDLLAKVQHLQREVLESKLEVSLEQEINMVLDPGSTSRGVILPLAEEIIFSPKADLYIQLLAVDILFFYPEDMLPVLERILTSDTISEDLKLKVLLTLSQELPNELLAPVTQVIGTQYSDTIRRIAVKTLGSIKDSALVPKIRVTLLEVAVTDSSPTVRAEAIEALSGLVGADSLEEIGLIVAKDDSEIVRWKGVEIFEKFSKHEIALELMRRIAKTDQLTQIRVRSAEALGQSALSPDLISDQVDARFGVVSTEEMLNYDLARQLSDRFMTEMADHPWKADIIVGSLQTSYTDIFKTSPETARGWMAKNSDVLRQLARSDRSPINLRLIMRRALREVSRRY